MKNEEVDRIFLVVSDPLRIKWETQRNAGQSLLELKKTRETALALEKKYRKKRTICFYALISCTALVALFLHGYFPFPKEGKVTLLGLAILLSQVVPVVVIYNIMDGNWLKQIDEIERCNGVLEKFAKSLAALDPLGIGNKCSDLIDERYVNSRAEKLAILVVDAQTTFDTLRMNPEANRHSVVYAGECVERCEADFNRFESNLRSDFGLLLDRRSIFRDAKAYLLKARPKA